jgi:hypothetical protein
MADGNIDQACAAFAASQKLDPGTGTLLNLATCHEQQGRLALAWAEFHQAKTQATSQQRVDRVELAVAAIARLEGRLAYVSLKGVPPSAAVQIDSVVVDADAILGSLPVDPGTRRVRITLPGKQPVVRTVNAAAGQTATVDVGLMRDVVIPPPPSRWPWLVGGGVAVLSLGAGVGFSVDAFRQKGIADRNCPANMCTPDGLAAQKRYDRSATIANVTLAVGAVAAITTTVLYLRYRKAARNRLPEPVLSANGMAVRWSF